MDQVERDRIKRLAKTRLETAFIFPISTAEEIFGSLWGENVSEDIPLSEAELQWERLFMAFRKQVLDHGNNQLRQFQKEIDSI